MHADDRFPDGVAWTPPEVTVTGVICVPLITRNEQCSCCIELFRDNGIPYERTEMEIVTLVVNWISAAIEQTQNFILQKHTEDINSSLLDMTRRFVADTDKFEVIMAEVVVSIIRRNHTK